MRCGTPAWGRSFRRCGALRRPLPIHAAYEVDGENGFTAHEDLFPFGWLRTWSCMCIPTAYRHVDWLLRLGEEKRG